MAVPARRQDRRDATARLGRRGLLGAGAGLGLALLGGCSALPSLPGIGGGGTSIRDLFSAIDPAIWGERTDSITWDEDPLYQPLQLYVSRPRAIGELFEVTDDLEPTSYNHDLPRAGLPRATQPSLFTTPAMAGVTTVKSPLTSNHFRYAPEVAVRARQSLREAVLWRGVDEGLFAEIEELLVVPGHGGEPPYRREGARLIPVDDMEPEGGFLPFLLEEAGTDLRIYQEQETPEFGGSSSAVDLFLDLQELMDAVDLPDAHIAQASSHIWDDEGAPTARHEGETATFVEWYYATELTSTTEHTTRGALRVRDGDLEVAQRSLLLGAENHRSTDLVVIEAERISEELQLVTMGSEAESPDPLGSFYDTGSGFSGPDVRLGS